MVMKSNPLRYALIGFWLLLLCQFGMVLHGLFSNYWISFPGSTARIETYAVFLFIGVVLFSSSNHRITFEDPANRILIAFWLLLLLLYSFQDVQSTISWYTGERFGNFGWPGYVVAGLLISIVPGLVLFNKRIAPLGVIKLTVITGFFIISVNHILDLIYGSHWYSIYGNLEGFVRHIPDNNDWAQATLNWIQTPYWAVPRLITYVALGYVLSKWKGVRLSAAVSILVVVIDATVGWLIYLPLDGLFEAAGLSSILQYAPSVVLRAYLIQIGILVSFALTGVFITRVRWPSPIPSKTRHYTVRRIITTNLLHRRH